MTPDHTTPGREQERERFEAWLKNIGWVSTFEAWAAWQASAALRAAITEPQPMTDERAWLMEHNAGGTSIWWDGTFSTVEAFGEPRNIASFTADPMAAVRFSTKEHGERVLAAMLKQRPCPIGYNAKALYSITEHLWLAPAAPNPRDREDAQLLVGELVAATLAEEREIELGADDEGVAYANDRFLRAKNRLIAALATAPQSAAAGSEPVAKKPSMLAFDAACYGGDWPDRAAPQPAAQSDEARELLRDAERFVQKYAQDNPCWTNGIGPTQDPWGAHAWLARFAALAQKGQP